VAFALAGALALPRVGRRPPDAEAKKKGKGKGKKTALCLDGQTVQAGSKKSKKKLLKRGATPGACCVSQCAGSTCGGNDGCGGTCRCAANAICRDGTCQPCTVVCSGDGAACGAQLQQALTSGGTITLCPGRYTGNFVMNAASTLVGAGQGDDPGSNTILDGGQAGRVLTVGAGLNASLTGLRLTGGKVTNADGGGISANGGELRVTSCAIVGNVVSNGLAGGIHSKSTLNMSASQVANNTANAGGGIVLGNAIPGEIVDSTISGNQATLGNAGGLIHQNAPLVIRGSEISGNRARERGGGIVSSTASLILDSSTRVITNTAGIEGGGILLFGTSTLFMNGATLSGNSLPQCVGGTGCPA